MAQDWPYYRAYPSDFITGSMILTAEEKGVYRTLLDVMYDGWAPIDWENLTERALKEQKRHLARLSGCSVRTFGAIVARLFLLKKVRLNSEKKITNDRFEKALRLRSASSGAVGDIYPEKNPPLKSGSPDAPIEGEQRVSSPASRARANPESRGYIPDESCPGQGQKGEPPALEPAVLRCCAVLGVDLQADIWRSNWTMQLGQMLTEDELDLELDVLPVLKAFKARPNPNIAGIRSLRVFRQDFIAARKSRLVTDQIRSRDASRKQQGDTAVISAATTDDWEKRIKTFLMIGAWIRSEVGPSPVEPGCKAPLDLLLKAEARWRANGNHPTTRFIGNQTLPWEPDPSNLFPEAMPFIIPESKLIPLARAR